MEQQNTKSGKFRLNLTPDEISLKNALEHNLGKMYQDEIDQAFYQDDKILLHRLMGLAKAHLHGE
jgi:hypothetical protein